MRLDRLKVLVAGSIAPDCAPPAAKQTHDIVRSLVRTLAPHGVRFELMPGRLPQRGTHGLPIAFDWEMIRELRQALKVGAPAISETGALVSCTTTQKTLERIPPEYREDWDALLAAKAMDLRFVPTGWSSGAIRRSRAAESSDALVAIGGGEGIEHLATECLRRGRPVIPIDIDVRGSCGDGSGGATKLLGDFLGAAQPPFLLADGSSPTARLSRLAVATRTENAAAVAQQVAEILGVIRSPRAFFVRLLTTDHVEFTAVEGYFRNVVDPVVTELGFEKFEMGAVATSDTWMNQEIFRHLNDCTLALVDITGLRFNCGIELGFAMGRNKRVIVTARDGTRPPFDIGQFKIHFWKDPAAASERAALLAHWALVRSRVPIVE